MRWHDILNEFNLKKVKLFQQIARKHTHEDNGINLFLFYNDTETVQF
jgi:hypothetical protein